MRESIDGWFHLTKQVKIKSINQRERRRNRNKREKKQIKTSLKFISDFSHFSFFLIFQSNFELILQASHIKPIASNV